MQSEEVKRNQSHIEWLKKLAKNNANNAKKEKLKKEREDEESRIQESKLAAKLEEDHEQGQENSDKD